MNEKLAIHLSAPAVAQAQVADAIAHVREAMLLAEEQEIDHALSQDEPCEHAHAASDAAMRDALLRSEDAMITVLQSLPGASQKIGPLVN